MDSLGVSAAQLAPFNQPIFSTQPNQSKTKKEIKLFDFFCVCWRWSGVDCWLGLLPSSSLAGYGPEAPLAAGELTSQKNNSFAAFLSLALINQLHTLRPPSEAKTAEKQI